MKSWEKGLGDDPVQSFQGEKQTKAQEGLSKGTLEVD